MMEPEAILYKKIKHAVGRAVSDHGLIAEGDRIAVGVSGGKDSFTLLHMLDSLRRRAPVRFEIMALTIDSGYPGFRTDIIASHLEEHRFEHHIETTDHYGIIQNKRREGSSYCSICARLKRGALYELAQRFNCNKLALGHHLDDFAETLLLNQFFVGSLKSMAASMLADNGVTTVIRPLVYVTEAQIIEYSGLREFPVVCCRCPACGKADMQRKRMKRLISELEREIPHIRQSILRALSNVQPRHLLDRRLSCLVGPPADDEPAEPAGAASPLSTP